MTTASSLKWFGLPANTRQPAAMQTIARKAWRGANRSARSLFAAVPAMDATADELFDRAAHYEATQPGYAADLRAAAQQARMRHFGGW